MPISLNSVYEELAHRSIIHQVAPTGSLLIKSDSSGRLYESIFHKSFSGQQIHTPFSWEYENSTERTSDTGFENEDIGKIAWQKDDNSVWILVAIDPVWSEITGGGSSGGASNLSELSDVSSVSYTDGYVLRANGSGYYVSGQLKHIDLTNVNSNDHHEPYTDSDALNIINTDSDHATSAPHDFGNWD